MKTFTMNKFSFFSKISAMLVFFAFVVNMAKAQDLTIASDDFSACEGNLNDTNPVGQYGNNEDETLTICGDGTNLPFNIYFIGFALGAGDALAIYDGPSTSSPLIGTFTGADLSNVNISSTNAAGCLTLHWTSDASEVGDFGAVIYCGPPCYHPLAQVSVANEDDRPIKICQGETLNFDASPTVFHEGNSFGSATWSFGDQTTSNMWPTISHTYNDPGVYTLDLVVKDNTDCASLNSVSIKVQVSTTPSFQLTSTPNCVGSEGVIEGAVVATPYIVNTGSSLGGAVYIPDAGTTSSDCFFDTIFVSGFASDAVITQPSDLDSLMAIMEHTYLTDITISFSCPNGSVISVYNQGGGLGNVDLGFPVPADDGVAGDGIEYSWGPASTNPNWLNILGTNFINPGGTDGGGYVVSGYYQSIDPWTNFVGCPLNGAWTIKVCDIVGADDGWIFDWGVFFNPLIIPENNSFTPVFDANCESTFWSVNGDFITNTNVLCDSVNFLIDVPGLYPFTYSATDDFGCTYTSLVNQVVYGPPSFVITDSLAYCGPNTTQLGDSIINTIPGFTYGYAWTPAENITLSNTQDPFVTTLAEPTWFFVDAWPVAPINDAACSHRDSVRVYLPEQPIDYNDSLLFICPGANRTINPRPQPLGMTYEWNSSTDGVFNANDDLLVSTAPGYVADSAAYYFLTVTNGCGDFVTTRFQVQEKPCEVIIHDVFTPNDGIADNNSFVFEGLENFAGSTLTIYNRWGTIVYETKDYRNDWSPNTDEASDGVYFYILGIHKPSGYEYHNGTVTILRKKD